MIAYGILLALFGSALSQGQHQVCTEETSFLRDDRQCDKYYHCFRGQMEEHLCPDGLLFDDIDNKCNYPFMIHNCPEDATLQPPIQINKECPRLNGFFEHEDPAVCSVYYECFNGQATERYCPEGLVFDSYSGACQWAHSSHRTGCKKHKITLDDGFSCPDEDVQLASNRHALFHTRYVNPTSCRSFYVCLQGKYPAHAGCPGGTVFSETTRRCDSPENVPGCEFYYEELEAQREAEENLNFKK